MSKVFSTKAVGSLLLGVTAFILCLLFINLCGGMDSDLGGDPDEAAHAVTALMLRDYVTTGLGQPPMRFAKAYYEDFPRVALGHYPPLYYLVATPLLLAQASIATLHVLQALLLALLAVLTFHLGRKITTAWLAAAAAIGQLVLPVTLKLALLVMSDILLAVLCMWAALLWAWYLHAPSMRRALVWGCVAAAAILTKGSGLGLCLLPPLGTLLAGRWRLALTPSWWCAALPVAALAGPWMLYSTKISKEGMTQLSPNKYFLEAVPYHLKAMPEVFGWPLTVLTVVGLIYGIIAGCKRKALSFEAASLTGMALGMVAVLLLVPVGLSTRYMLTLAPVVVITAAFGMDAIPWRGSTSRFGKPLLLVAIASAPFLWNGIPQKEVHGFTEAVTRSGTPALGERKKNWLVASDPRGEGAIIAAASFNCPQRFPSPLRVYRGSKELASSDWMGRGYHAAFRTSKELLEHLERLNIIRVFVDLSVPASQRKEHERLLETALDNSKTAWALDFEQTVTRSPGQNGRMRVYKRL
jgi:hypothetical protein